MSFAILRHFYRDRRRIAVSLVLLTGIIILGHNTLPDPPPVQSEILRIVLILALIPLITLKFRRHRHLVEVVLFGTLVHFALAALLPNSPWDYTGIFAFSPLGWMSYAASLWGARWFLYGHWADRFTSQRKFDFEAQAHSRLSAAALWYGLVPTPGHIEHNPDPDVVSIDYAAPDRRTIRMVTWRPPSPPGEVLIHIDAMTPLHSVTLRLEVLSGLREAETEGTTRFTIHDHGSYRRVVVGHEIDALSPRRMFGGWIDDRLGRMMDARLDAVERSASRTKGRRAAFALEDWWDETKPAETRGRRAGADIGGGGQDYTPAYGRELSARERHLLAATRASLPAKRLPAAHAPAPRAPAASGPRPASEGKPC